MVDYVEYPTDTLVRIVVPKKPDDGGGGGPPVVQGPCGMWTSVERAGGYWSPQSGGLYTLKQGQRTVTTTNPDGSTTTTTEQGLIWSYVNHVSIAGDGSRYYANTVDYLWNGPAGFTISFTHPSNPTFVTRINVWRNFNPQTWHPCTDAPTIIAGTSVDILPQQPTEEFPPIFMIINTNYPGNCSDGGALISVQGHCEHETVGDLVPLPFQGLFFWNYLWIGPALPGSVYYRG